MNSVVHLCHILLSIEFDTTPLCYSAQVPLNVNSAQTVRATLYPVFPISIFIPLRYYQISLMDVPVLRRKREKNGH